MGPTKREIFEMTYLMEMHFILKSFESFVPIIHTFAWTFCTVIVSKTKRKKKSFVLLLFTLLHSILLYFLLLKYTMYKHNRIHKYTQKSSTLIYSPFSLICIKKNIAKYESIRLFYTTIWRNEYVCACAYIENRNHATFTKYTVHSLTPYLYRKLFRI